MGIFTAWPQILMALLCNLSVLTGGLVIGWLSPLQPSLQSTNSPLGADVAPMSDEEVSWIGALPSVTLILGAPIFGYTSDRFGRKFSLLLANLPNIATYLLLIFAQGPYLVYISRLIGGFCACGGFVIAPIYVSECAQESWKGTLGGLTGFFVKFGIIISYFLGAFTSYLALNLISMSFTVIFLCFYFWIPESPVYLVTKGKYAEARRVLKKLRQTDVELIVKNIQCQLEVGKVEGSLAMKLKNFFTEKPVRKAAFIGAGIFAFQMFSGHPAVIRYCVDILNDAKITFSSYVAAIILGVIQMVCAFLGSLMLNKCGRKSMLIGSLGTMGSCMAILAGYLAASFYLPEHWFLYKIRHLPVIALMVFVAAYALAFGSVPFMIIPEIFAPEYRSIASSILNMWVSFVEFIVAKLFPTLTNVIFMWGTFLTFAVLSLVGIIFLVTVMFETKGLTFNEIFYKLGGKNLHVPPDGISDKLLLPSKNCNDSK